MRRLENTIFPFFSVEQPDLNWENPDVRAAVHDIIRFWLDRGVYSFHMNVIDHISKVQSFPDAEETITGQYHQPGDKFYANRSPLFEFFCKELGKCSMSMIQSR